MHRARILLIGHSHTNCIVQALRRSYEEQRVEAQHVHLNQLLQSLARQQTVVNPEDVAALELDAICEAAGRFAPHPSPVAAGELADFVAENQISTVLSIRGTAHMFMGLVRQEPAYDFVLKGEEDLPLDESAVLLPYGAIRKQYETRLSGAMKSMASLQARLPHNLYCLEIPPPYADNTFIERRIGGWFHKHYPDGFEIAPALLRYKLWRVCVGIYREHSERLGITYVPAPRSAIVEGGYLNPRGYFDDAFHANEWYGERAVSELLLAIERSGATTQVLA